MSDKIIWSEVSPLSILTNGVDGKVDKAKMKELLADNVRAIAGMLLIFARQTACERATDSTTEANGVGFGAFDAGIMSSFAKNVLTWNPNTSQYPYPLSYKQMMVAKKRIAKYAGQLTNIVNGN